MSWLVGRSFPIMRNIALDQKTMSGNPVSNGYCLCAKINFDSIYHCRTRPIPADVHCFHQVIFVWKLLVLLLAIACVYLVLHRTSPVLACMGEFLCGTTSSSALASNPGRFFSYLVGRLRKIGCLTGSAGGATTLPLTTRDPRGRPR